MARGGFILFDNLKTVEKFIQNFKKWQFKEADPSGEFFEKR